MGQLSLTPSQLYVPSRCNFIGILQYATTYRAIDAVLICEALPSFLYSVSTNFLSAREVESQHFFLSSAAV